MRGPQFSYHLPVVTGIAGLTEHQREIVRLRCDHELTIAEVAAALGIAEQTVKSLCATIMRKTGRKTFAGICRDYGACAAMTAHLDSFRAETV